MLKPEALNPKAPNSASNKPDPTHLVPAARRHVVLTRPPRSKQRVVGSYVMSRVWGVGLKGERREDYLRGLGVFSLAQGSKVWSVGWEV